MHCKEASDMILKGERRDSLEQQLGQCPECRSLNEDLRRISAMADMPLPEVPEKLDRAILACAAEQSARRTMGPTLLFRMPVLRAVAAVAVLAACAVLTFSVMTNGGSAAVPRPLAVAETTQGSEGDVLDFLTNSAELDADLLALSVELDQTESDMQLIASVSASSWYSAAAYGDF